MNKLTLIAYVAMAVVTRHNGSRETPNRASSPETVAEYISSLGDGYEYVVTEDDILESLNTMKFIGLVTQKGKDTGSKTTFLLVDDDGGR